MALARTGVEVLGCFREKTYGRIFEYYEAEENAFGMPHRVCVGGLAGDETRFANVKKTVAYIVVDEAGNGDVVTDKWNIRQLR